MGRNNSGSPVARGSHRRSPSRRERSPGQPRNSNTDMRSTRNFSPKRASSGSPELHSPARVKPHSRTKSPKYRRSPSPGKKKLGRVRSPEPIHSRSPSPVKGKPSSRTRSPNRVSSRSAVSHVIAKSRSPSPRSKRLKRAAAEHDDKKRNGGEYDISHGKKQARSRHEDKDMVIERKERRPERDAARNGSRSRHRRSASLSDHDRRGQRRSRSPPYGSDERGHDEPANLRGEDQR